MRYRNLEQSLSQETIPNCSQKQKYVLLLESYRQHHHCEVTLHLDSQYWENNLNVFLQRRQEFLQDNYPRKGFNNIKKKLMSSLLKVLYSTFLHSCSNYIKTFC